MNSSKQPYIHICCAKQEILKTRKIPVYRKGKKTKWRDPHKNENEKGFLGWHYMILKKI